MKAQWEQMSPNMKRGLSVAGIAGGLILMVMVFSPNPDDGSSSRNRQETIRHILTDTNTRDVGVDSLAANVKLLSERNEQLRREVEVMQQLKALIAVSKCLYLPWNCLKTKSHCRLTQTTILPMRRCLIRSISSQPMAKAHEHGMFHCRQSRFV